MANGFKQSSLVDLGGARRHQDENGTCYPQTAANMNETVCTKPFYCRTLRKGLTQSRRDDMETLGYALLDMGAFKLPWDNCKNETKITEEQNKLCDDVEVRSYCCAYIVRIICIIF